MLRIMTAALLVVAGSAHAFEFSREHYARAGLQANFEDGAANCYESRFAGFIIEGERDVPRLRLRTLAACAPLIRLAFRTSGNLADDDAVMLWEYGRGLGTFESLHIPYNPDPRDWSKQALKELMAEKTTNR